MTTPRHKYDYQVQPDSAPARVVRLAGRNKRVLELGSGPGAVTRLLKSNGCRVTALEVDEQAIMIVREFCEQVHQCNLNDAGWPGVLDGAEPFDVIVAADVFEHLYDPWAALARLPALLAPGGCAVVSLPHAGHNAVIGCLASGDLEYQPWGLLDKTHIRFFGVKNIQRLFEDAGFKIIEVEMVVKTPEQTEFARRWRMLPVELRTALAATPFGTIYQVVVRAVPKTAPGGALDLARLPVPALGSGTFAGRAGRSRLLGFAVSFLSLDLRNRIANGLRRIGLRV